ncbi:MAG TPA: hypothetical protein VGD67_08125 [Pseudonocardiaceae bacterium]
MDLVAGSSPTSVFVVGTSHGSSPEDGRTRILHWDGSEWTDLHFPMSNPRNVKQVYGAAAIDERLLLVGDDDDQRAMIIEWTGDRWHRHDPPPEAQARWFADQPAFCRFQGVVAFAADDIWICGCGMWPGFSGPLLFHWDGAGWRTVSPGLHQPRSVFTAITGSSADDLYVTCQLASDLGPPLVLRGDAESWQVLDGLPPVTLPDVVRDAAGHLWVLQGSPNTSALARYDADHETWLHLMVPMPPGAAGVHLSELTAVPNSTALIAVGRSDHPGGPDEPYTPHAVILQLNQA